MAPHHRPFGSARTAGQNLVESCSTYMKNHSRLENPSDDLSACNRAFAVIKISGPKLSFMKLQLYPALGFWRVTDATRRLLLGEKMLTSFARSRGARAWRLPAALRQVFMLWTSRSELVSCFKMLRQCDAHCTVLLFSEGAAMHGRRDAEGCAQLLAPAAIHLARASTAQLWKSRVVGRANIQIRAWRRYVASGPQLRDRHKLSDESIPAWMHADRESSNYRHR